MRRYVDGLMLAIQFFTIFPIRREIPMTAKNVDGLIRMLPLFGFLFGGIYAGIAYMLIAGTSVSPLMVSFILWLLAIVLTGALHLDGWIDASDAFFSYRDRERRLEIMSDPQTGAFGVISVLVLLATKFVFIYEVITKLETISYLLIILIPFFARILTGLILVLLPPAKKSGLGFYFQQAVQRGTLKFYAIYLIPISLLLWVWHDPHYWMVLVMVLCTLIAFFLLRKKIVQWFGGMTGDIAGAAQEGMEVFLWIIVWGLHFFVMG